MKLTPLADNVLLKHMEAEEKTASGIILSTANKEKSVIAEVISAGPGTDDVKVTVKPGDKVVTGKYAGQAEARRRRLRHRQDGRHSGSCRIIRV